MHRELQVVLLNISEEQLHDCFDHQCATNLPEAIPLALPVLVYYCILKKTAIAPQSP
jgi:hypothetical protein